MAREDIRELYRELVDSEFKFVPRGEQSIEVIYQQVQLRYPHLCDDDYLCVQNCQGAWEHLPEWQHAVRRALDRLKRISGSVLKGNRRGEWILR